MAAEDLDDLVRSCEALPVPAILTTLDTHRFVAVNEGAARLFGMPASDLVGRDILAHIDPRDREAAGTAYAAMASKVIDGYQVRRRVVLPSGETVAINVSGRRVEAHGKLYGLWILSPTSEPSASSELLIMGATDIVLAVTDHDWQIEYLNADAHLLGFTGSELRDFPLLGLIHPLAAAGFLAAIAQTVADRIPVTVFTRMRVGHNQWADRHCMLVPVCDHQPPRLGVVISASPSTAAAHALGPQLDEQARHCALEARAAQILEALPMLASLPQGSELSARQTEIVARLVEGQGVPEIARSMFLSPSTVRNHLVAIYRKFGVHSKAELLAVLLRASARFTE